MNSLLIFIAGIVLLGLLIPKSASSRATKSSWRNGLSYGVFVLLLAASPLIGSLFAIAIGIEVSARVALSFSWIGVVASLPISLLVARLFGADCYASFWSYLEAAGNTTKRRIVTIWIVISVSACVIGMLAFALSGATGANT